MDNNILEIKNTVIELINNINVRIDGICGSYGEDGTIQEDRVISLLDDLQVLAEGINSIKEYYNFLDLSEFSEKLVMIGNALEDHDTALFSDLMQYELKNLLKFWLDSLS